MLRTSCLCLERFHRHESSGEINILVLISDLHITDKSTAFNVDPDAFTKILKPKIKDMANKRGETEIHLVLLGDIFDLVRTDYWHRCILRKDRP